MIINHLWVIVILQRSYRLTIDVCITKETVLQKIPVILQRMLGVTRN